MKPVEISRLLDVSVSTVKQWTTLYRDYISESGRGGGGVARDYTNHDARVFAFIAGLRNQGKGLEDIAAALDAAQRDNWAGLPDVPSLPDVSIGRHEERELETRRLVKQIIALESTVETLQTQLDAQRAQLDAKDTTITGLQQRISDAQRELGVLEGRLQEVRPVGFWLRVIAGVVIGAAIIALALVALVALT
jgi:DNA-binding transcriptional MerR regulator